jgi:two-component system, LytTR family, sensor kinase
VEEQNDRLERLEAQATSAQLAMLRYQLNPHFLFNTLNSISTLVLLKQTAPANAMLTRLSSFLRHTLVMQPGARVTIAQELRPCSSTSRSSGCASRNGCAPSSASIPPPRSP